MMTVARRYLSWTDGFYDGSDGRLIYPVCPPGADQKEGGFRSSDRDADRSRSKPFKRLADQEVSLSRGWPIMTLDFQEVG